MVQIVLPRTGRTPGWVLASLVGTLTLALAGAGWHLLRRRGGSSTTRTGELLGAMVALDVRYAGRESETAADEWSSYLAERARIKARLEASLAAEGRSG
jgi:hypothetical protein